MSIKVFSIMLALAGTMAIVSCGADGNDDKDGKHLSTDLVNNPQSADGLDSVKRNSLAVITFEDTTHNFGNIKEGETVTHDFSFTNTGKEPLLITSANGTCGCTVPEFPTEPIAPGAKGNLKVTFHSKGKPGHQEKMVTINSNDQRGRDYLFIQAEVN